MNESPNQLQGVKSNLAGLVILLALNSVAMTVSYVAKAGACVFFALWPCALVGGIYVPWRWRTISRLSPGWRVMALIAAIGLLAWAAVAILFLDEFLPLDRHD